MSSESDQQRISARCGRVVDDEKSELAEADHNTVFLFKRDYALHIPAFAFELKKGTEIEVECTYIYEDSVHSNPV